MQVPSKRKAGSAGVARLLSEDTGAVFVEYALLLPVILLGCAAILPGAAVYDWLRMERDLRLALISLPIF
jgi:Flp pilus assembly pilin Flp